MELQALTRADRSALRPVFEDPVRFSRGVLGDRPWSTQQAIMRAVADHPLVAVKACHASGKTHAAGRLALWWLLRWKDAKVITTAPTWRQVKLIWAEIGDACRGSRIPMPEPSQTGIKFSDQHYAIGLSTNDPTKFQGYHGEKVLIIVDEATGVLASIYDAIEGIRAGGDVRVLLLGNPTVPGGKFYETFTRERSLWKLFTISAFDTPNLRGLTETALLAMNQDELQTAESSFLVTRRWVAERWHRWGPTHPMYRARVLGEFPEQSELSVYSLAWIERASHEPAVTPTAGLIQVGIDVAGPGEDETALVARVGGHILCCRAWAKADPRGEVLAELARLRALPGFALGPIVVDAVGIGYYMAAHVADAGYQVYGFNAGGRPMDTEHFVNAKAEAYWALREWLERGAVSGLEDEEAQAQLAGIRYQHTAGGRIEIEQKEKARKRGQASPDRAEAHVLAFTRAVPREVSVSYGPEDYEISPI